MAECPLAKCPLAICPLVKCPLAKYPLAKCPGFFLNVFLTVLDFIEISSEQ